MCATKAEWKIHKKERIVKRKYLSAVCDYNWANRKCKVYKSNQAKMRASVAIAMLTFCTMCVLATAPVRPGGGTNPSPRLPRTSASQFPKNSTSRSSTTKPTFRTRWVSVLAFDRLLFCFIVLRGFSTFLTLCDINAQYTSQWEIIGIFEACIWVEATFVEQKFRVHNSHWEVVIAKEMWKKWDQELQLERPKGI